MSGMRHCSGRIYSVLEEKESNPRDAGRDAPAHARGMGVDEAAGREPWEEPRSPGRTLEFTHSVPWRLERHGWGIDTEDNSERFWETPGAEGGAVGKQGWS